MKKIIINIRRIIGLLLIPISFLVPRKKNKWIFGSNMGYTGNAKHLFIHVLENKVKDIEAYWITDKKQDVAKLKSIGMPVEYKWSLSGLYNCLTSKVYLYNSYVSDINEYTFGNVCKFNLWHGIGLKHIERTKKNPEKKYVTHNPLVKFRYFRFLIKPNLVLSPSPLETDLFAPSFGVEKSQCVESTYPRNEVLNYDKKFIKEYIDRYEFDKTILDLIHNIEKYDHRIIYMPTWRDSGRNFLEQIGFDLSALDKTLREINGCLIFKLHPATQISVDSINLKNIFVLKNNIDIYPVLPFTDCLITDYSSIYFDYILMREKRVILFIPDYEEYTRGDRDFAFPFDESVEGEKIYNFKDLLESLLIWNPAVFNSHDRIIRKFWDPKLKGNDELIAFVKKKIK